MLVHDLQSIKINRHFNTCLASSIALVNHIRYIKILNPTKVRISFASVWPTNQAALTLAAIYTTDAQLAKQLLHEILSMIILIAPQSQYMKTIANKIWEVWKPTLEQVGDSDVTTFGQMVDSCRE